VGGKLAAEELLRAPGLAQLAAGDLLVVEKVLDDLLQGDLRRPARAVPRAGLPAGRSPGRLRL
jgi:hypothetical protein